VFIVDSTNKQTHTYMFPIYSAVAVECCYQNTGIATSVAITMFQGDDLATAVGVPLFYGICEAVILAIYCLGAWKAGWTKAPKDENICVVIATSYEVQEATLADPEAIEVILGSPEKDGGGGWPSDLIFSTTSEGYQIDEESLHALEKGTSKSVDGTVDDETITSELEKEQELDSPVSETTQDASAIRRHGSSHYSSLEADMPSPLTERTSVTSPALKTLAAPLDNENDTIPSGGIRLGLAMASLRSRGNSKYAKAVSDVEVAAVEGDEDEQNFEFPAISEATSRKSSPGGHISIPVEDKTID
jgi:hypothetical protein